MKKNYKLLLLFLLILATCGCGNKLICTKETTGEINHLNITFKKAKPENLKWQRTIIFASDDAYIDMSYLELQEYYSQLDNIQGLTYEVKEKDKNDRIIVTIDIDFNIYKENNTFSLPISLDNLKTNKTNLENSGYKCK